MCTECLANDGTHELSIDARIAISHWDWFRLGKLNPDLPSKFIDQISAGNEIWNHRATTDRGNTGEHCSNCSCWSLNLHGRKFFSKKLSRKPLLLYPFFDLHIQNNCWIGSWSCTSIHIQSGWFRRQVDQSFLKPCRYFGRVLVMWFLQKVHPLSFPKRRFQWKHTIFFPKESKSKTFAFSFSGLLKRIIFSVYSESSTLLELDIIKQLKIWYPKKLPFKHGFFLATPTLRSSTFTHHDIEAPWVGLEAVLVEGIRPDGAVEAWNRQGSSVVPGGFWGEPSFALLFV